MVGLKRDQNFRRAVDQWYIKPDNENYSVVVDHYEEFKDNETLQFLRQTEFPPITAIKAMKFLERKTGLQLNSEENFIHYIENQKDYRVNKFAEVLNPGDVNKSYYFTFQEYDKDIFIDILHGHIIDRKKYSGFYVNFFSSKDSLKTIRVRQEDILELMRLYIENKLQFKTTKNSESMAFNYINLNNLYLRFPDEKRILRKSLEKSKNYQCDNRNLYRITPASLVEHAIKTIEYSSKSMEECFKSWKNKGRILEIELDYVEHHFDSMKKFEKEVKKRMVVESL